MINTRHVVKENYIFIYLRNIKVKLAPSLKHKPKMMEKT